MLYKLYSLTKSQKQQKTHIMSPLNTTRHKSMLHTDIGVGLLLWIKVLFAVSALTLRTWGDDVFIRSLLAC